MRLADVTLGDCIFYHTMDLPGHGTIQGMWDHRGTADVFLGRTDFRGKTVLDVGPGSGFWAFEMERRGAQVTALELGVDDNWDLVPHQSIDLDLIAEERRGAIIAVANSLIFGKCALKSPLKIVRGNCYYAPSLVGKVDIALMGNILQHLRDPFLGIERVADRVTERLIISETLWVEDDAFMNSASLRLIPRFDEPGVNHSWYQVSPVFVGETLKILGFPKLTCEIHNQWYAGGNRFVPHFTYTGTR